ncbi:MAG: Gfo/Idh/MocA family oxidoreductase [Firmicutes bacterium]|nr:Gfo/Idh/MocA family oxidoreductase [Bacillota bacterium]
MKKLKVGIIGVGMAFEKLHYPAFQKLADRYQITALCDMDEQKTTKWAGKLQINKEKVYTDFHEMLEKEDLDVVDIMVPIELNYIVNAEVARKLAGQRKGIINEKPLAPNIEQARSARELAQKYDMPIMIAENYRYNEENNVIRDLVRTKRIGEVFYFIYNRVIDFPSDMLKDKFSATEWRQYPEFPGGQITDSAIHDVAAMRHIFGPINKVQAFGREQQAEFSPYSVVCANLQFSNGIPGQFSFFCSGKEMQRPLIGLRIFGSQGMIYLEERNSGVINIAYNDGKQEQVKYQPEQGYYNELLNFYNALTGKEPVSVTPEMEYGDLKTVQDILKSAREERIVHVDEETNYHPIYQQPEYQQPNLTQ